jgi:hypothetical protein
MFRNQVLIIAACSGRERHPPASTATGVSASPGKDERAMNDFAFRKGTAVVIGAGDRAITRDHVEWAAHNFYLDYYKKSDINDYVLFGGRHGTMGAGGAAGRADRI